ncbi:hypothetical protein [Desulfosporosinus hippei]|uniref:Uncharacterized protein n=1 Tax=Desulfosporosinus hippei DSM 8344 TaxID=1121419 RepID=A0A1G8L890_9FIRM|nr:hypothetical protein [Desulfosporosinus hippei]SDI51831.1 hypothetical protein SAMN05443529_1469 [Desulfosporosinus hippei DSM 8344]
MVSFGADHDINQQFKLINDGEKHLLIDGQKASLEQTIMDNYDKLQDGTIIHTRTMRFLGTGDELKLDVQRMTYTTSYDKVLEIPIN